MSFADTVAAIREQGGLVYLPHPFDRMHAIPDPATLHRHLAEIDVFEVYNARLLFEAYNDEALRFARKYGLSRAPARTRTCSRASAPERVRMRALRRPGGVPALAPRRRDPAPPEVARVPPEPEVGRPGQGKGPLGENEVHAPVTPAVTTDEIYERYLDKAIAEINELWTELGALRGRAARARPRLRPPARRRLPAQVDAAAVGDPGGVAFFGRAGQALLKSLAAAARRPAGRLRHELPQVRHRGPRTGGRLADARAAHRPAEARSS